MEHINVNLVPGGVPSICHASQYDEGRVIRAHLLDGILPHTLSGTETIILSMRKPDLSKHVYTLENSSSDYIDIVTTSDMCSVAGESECEFIITDSSNVIGTANFKMKIESDAYGDSLKTRSVSGPIATFETDIAENLIKLDVDLEPIQDLHGYDGAWPAGGEKNLFDISTCVPGYLYSSGKSIANSDRENLVSDFIPVIENQTYVYTSYPTTHDDPWIGWSFYTEKDMNSVIEISSEKYRDVSYRETVRFTTPSGAKYIRIGARYLDNGGNAQVEKGSAATSFVPYSNICPISGHDSVQLIRTGKNLLHNILESIEVNGTTITVNEDKSITVSGTPSARVCVYINNLDHIKFGKKTKFSSGTMPSGTRVFCSRKINDTVDYPTISPSLTLQPNIEYYDFRLEINTSYDGSAFTIYPQLELGEAVTSYEPYISNPTPITVNFGQTVYEGHLDSTNRKVLVTKKGVKIKDLTWSYVSSFTYFSATVDDMLSNTEAGQVLDGLMCEVYTNRTPAQAGSGNKNGSIAGFYNAIRIKDLAYDDKDDLIDAVGDYLIVYPLAEPFYIDLTQPVPAGINKLPFEDIIQEGWTNTISDITATYSNGVVHVEGTNNSGDWANIVQFINAWQDNPITLPAGTYIMSENLAVRCSIDGESYANKSTSFTAESSVVVQGFYVSVRNGDTVDWDIPLMFINGTTRPTEYFPYYVTADPIRIPALVGTNNVYSNAGDVDVEYYTTLEGGND